MMKYFLTATLAVWIVAVGLICYKPVETIKPNPRWGVASPIVKAAHKYHGIKHSQFDEFGFGYFYRDSQRCRLFTRAFLKSWRKEVNHD